MTIARNAEGEAVGQVVASLPPGTLKDPLPAHVDAIVLLGKGGRYVTVPRSSVRLEDVR